MLMYDQGVVMIQKMGKQRYFASTMSMDLYNQVTYLSYVFHLGNHGYDDVIVIVDDVCASPFSSLRHACLFLLQHYIKI